MPEEEEPEAALFGDIDAWKRLLDPAVDVDKELADMPRLREIVKILRGETPH